MVTVLAARTGRWWTAAAAGLVAGLVRPVGIVLVVPVLIEVLAASALGSQAGQPPWPGWRRRGGTGGGDRRPTWPGSGGSSAMPWLPFRVQQQNGHRGVVTLPLAAMAHNLESVVHGHHLGSALHVPWVVLCVALAVVAFRRLPLSYAAFAAAVLAVSVASSNLDSFERYALGRASPGDRRLDPDLPTPGWRWWCWSLAGLGMVGYATLAFMGVVVP